MGGKRTTVQTASGYAPRVSEGPSPIDAEQPHLLVLKPKEPWFCPAAHFVERIQTRGYHLTHEPTPSKLEGSQKKYRAPSPHSATLRQKLRAQATKRPEITRKFQELIGPLGRALRAARTKE
jgi:hypothetical protein